MKKMIKYTFLLFKKGLQSLLNIGIIKNFSLLRYKLSLKHSQKVRFKLTPEKQQPSLPPVKIVISAGSAPRYNGGIKLYNLYAKLLIENGYPAYLATKEDKYESWLVKHQPVIHYKDITLMRDEGADIRIMTGWLDIPETDRILNDGQFYYFDAELKWTLYFRKKLEYYLKHNMIAGIATHSRYIQSWYLANYGIRPILINEWSDPDIFFQDPNKRIPRKLGCMVSNDKERKVFDILQTKCKEFGLCESFIDIKGNEKNVADEMRSTDIFIGLNHGKHDIWGEGCPRTQQEAMHCGCTLVAFDVLGNREYLYDGWTGLMVSSGDVNRLWHKIHKLLVNESEKERLRENGLNYVSALFSPFNKINLVKRFLNIDTTQTNS